MDGTRLVRITQMANGSERISDVHIHLAIPSFTAVVFLRNSPHRRMNSPQAFGADSVKRGGF